MISIDEMKKNRFQFLKRLWEITEGDTGRVVFGIELGKELGFDQGLTSRICHYLHEEGLIDFMGARLSIVITHDGVCEVEDALSNPDKPTEHFLPVNIINIGQMYNSQIQQASPGATQTVAINETKYEELKEIIQAIKSSIEQFGLDSQNIADLKAEIGTIEAQLSSSKTKRSIISECLGSIREILEEAGGGLAATFLAKLIGL